MAMDGICGFCGRVDCGGLVLGDGCAEHFDGKIAADGYPFGRFLAGDGVDVFGLAVGVCAVGVGYRDGDRVPLDGYFRRG